MEYRDIIKKEIEKLSKKKSPKNKKYREWVIGQLLEDLQDYETGGQKRWEREPYDLAWEKYGRSIQVMDIDEIFRRFFGNFGW